MAKLGLPLKNLDLRRWPDGHLMQGFGESCALYTEAFLKMGSPSRCHNGLDLVTYENDECIAVCDGTILKADFGETTHGYGVWLLSDPEGERTWLFAYFHLNALAVKTGDRIIKGQVLGWEGNTGFIVSGNTPYWGNAPAGKGVHLHFGVYPFVNGQKEFPNNNENGAVDPVPLLRPDISEALSAIDQAKQLIAKVIAFLKGRKIS